jgi:hypothetical protein
MMRLANALPNVTHSIGASSIYQRAATQKKGKNGCRMHGHAQRHGQRHRFVKRIERMDVNTHLMAAQ